MAEGDSHRGILGCAAVSDGLAVCTATDGKVRAFKVADGERALALRREDAILCAARHCRGRSVRCGFGRHRSRHRPEDREREVDIRSGQGDRAPGMVYGGVTAYGGNSSSPLATSMALAEQGNRDRLYWCEIRNCTMNKVIVALSALAARRAG